MVLRAGPDPLLTGHSDSDWAGCATTGRSQSGFVIRFGNALISWRAIKQSDTAQSSCEAEYIATNEVAKEATWWRGFLAEMGHPQPGPIPLFCDNKSTCSLARHSGNFEATKHIRHRYHYVRECCERGELIVHWIRGTDQWADIFTKNVSKRIFERATTRCYAQMGRISTSTARNQKCVCTRCWVGRKTLDEVVYRDEMFT